MDKSILETIHEGVEGLHEAKLADDTTLREFDELCLPTDKDLSDILLALSKKRWHLFLIE